MMNTDLIPEVSICIPAYKERELLERCLISIKNQTYKNFEVIISDDTPSDVIKNWIERTDFAFDVNYRKNEKSLGSPSNWNNAVKFARGKYIKIMHQDDWFACNNSLGEFVAAMENNSETDFIFAIYRDYKDGELLPSPKGFREYLQNWIEDKSKVIEHNFIGDPSTSIFRNGLNIYFDERLKWCVDFDFYLSIYEKNKNIKFIDKHLINIGTHAGQITHKIGKDAAIVVYEHIVVLNKHKINSISLKHFDIYWRMFRNFNVRTLEKLKTLAKEESLPKLFQQIILAQNRIPESLLKSGIISKIGMFSCYVINKIKKI